MYPAPTPKKLQQTLGGAEMDDTFAPSPTQSPAEAAEPQALFYVMTTGGDLLGGIW